MAFQGDSIYWVEVEKVVPNPFQPRREFDQNKLQELGDSIRMYGVLQPLTVTRKEVQREDGTFYSEYELIAGERRLRASKLAGVAQVPVIIREGEQSEQEKLELAIIENLQREDLNAIDRAIAFKQLSEQFGLSHSQVAAKVGRSREYVSNSIRLLALPEQIQQALRQGGISEGLARTLLMLSDRPQEQDVIFREAMLKKLSVREVERIVRKIASDRVRKKNPNEFDATLIELEKKFTETLGTRVQIQKTDFGGKLTIDYFSEDDLAVLLRRIKEDEHGSGSVAEAMAKLNSDTPLMVQAAALQSGTPVSQGNAVVESSDWVAESYPANDYSDDYPDVLERSSFAAEESGDELMEEDTIFVDSPDQVAFDSFRNNTPTEVENKVPSQPVSEQQEQQSFSEQSSVPVITPSEFESEVAPQLATPVIPVSLEDKKPSPVEEVAPAFLQQPDSVEHEMKTETSPQHVAAAVSPIPVPEGPHHNSPTGEQNQPTEVAAREFVRTQDSVQSAANDWQRVATVLPIAPVNMPTESFTNHNPTSEELSANERQSPAPAPISEPEKDDESDLYSIRNFNV